MKSISRVVPCSLNAVNRLLVLGGTFAWVYYDRVVRNIRAGHVQCDEIWAFAYAWRLNVPRPKDPPDWVGDVWTWTALALNSRLMVSYWVGDRE